MGALGSSSEVPEFNIYTEVFQEEALRLLMEGRVAMASTGALTISSTHLQELYRHIDRYSRLPPWQRAAKAR